MARFNVIRVPDAATGEKKIVRIALEVTDPQQIADLERLLDRSLNCWEGPPRWLMEFSDEVKFGVPLLSAKVF